MTINTSLIIVACSFVAIMYFIYRLFNYLDYEQRHNKTQVLQIENVSEKMYDKYVDQKLEEM